jgi:hypothetical protein
MKQTAVEWLVEELSDVLGPMDTNSIRDLLLTDAINRAKEIEKEQMLKTFTESRVISVECAVWNCEGDRRKWESFEQYYNETFNTNEK